jgi:hypothetical protein
LPYSFCLLHYLLFFQLPNCLLFFKTVSFARVCLPPTSTPIKSADASQVPQIHFQPPDHSLAKALTAAYSLPNLSSSSLVILNLILTISTTRRFIISEPILNNLTCVSVYLDLPEYKSVSLFPQVIVCLWSRVEVKLHAFLTLALDGDERLSLHSDRVTPGSTTLSTNCTWGRVHSRGGFDTVAKIKIPTLDTLANWTPVVQPVAFHFIQLSLVLRLCVFLLSKPQETSEYWHIYTNCVWFM